MRFAIYYIGVLSVALVLSACGTQDKEDTVDLSKHYPLKVGNFWEYKETIVTTTNGVEAAPQYQTTKHQVVNFESRLFEELDGLVETNSKKDVFVIKNQVLTGANKGESRTYFLEEINQELRRTGQIKSNGDQLDKKRFYVPGALKFSKTSKMIDESWQESSKVYEWLFDKDKQQWVQGNDWNKWMVYNWEVTALNEKVTVPAGTFNCAVFRRTILHEEKTYFFAANIGKVKEISNYTQDNTAVKKTEELTEYGALK